MGRGMNTAWEMSAHPMDENSRKILDAFEGLLTILKRLLAPGGCPWDRKQTEKTMAPLILEEAYEAADAIEDGDAGKTTEELGDLSMNLLMTCLIAEKNEILETEEVFRKISRKLINRHPHVFGDRGFAKEDQFLQFWEDIKKQERNDRKEDASALAGVPRAMPALLRALRMSEKLRRTGADLPFLRNPADQARVLFDEVISTPHSPDEPSREKKMGKLFYTLVLAAMERDINPEMALRAHLGGLERSFRQVESRLGDSLKDAAAEELDRLFTGDGRDEGATSGEEGVER
jgi:MazG family protein